MRAKIILLLSLVMLNYSGCMRNSSQTNSGSNPSEITRFVKILGDSDPQEAFALIEAQDGNYVMLGYTTNYGSGGSSLKGRHDMFLAKFSPSGNINWARAVGYQDAFDLGLGIVQSMDGGYLLNGVTEGSGAGMADVFVSKFDTNGSHQWSKTIGGADNDWGYSVVQIPDGSYILAGKTRSFGAGDADLLLTRLDSYGEHQWTITLGGVLADFDAYYGPAITLTSDNKIVVAGSTASFGAGLEDVLVCKLDLYGNLLWARTLGGTGSDLANSVIETEEGSYLITGTTYSVGAGSGDILLSKFSTDGTHIWTRTLGGANTEYGRSVVRSGGQGYAIAGSSISFSSNYQDFFVSIFDSADNLLGATKLPMGDPSQTRNFAKCFIHSSDGGYVLSGETTVPYMPRIPFVKLDARGETCGSVPVIPLIEDQTRSVTITDPASSSISLRHQNPIVLPGNPAVNSISPAISTSCED